MRTNLSWCNALVVGLTCATSLVGAQEVASRSEQAVPPIPESRIMHESFWYSAYASRSWVVGYAPKSTSLFLNPRENPPVPRAPIIWQHAYGGTLKGFCTTTFGARPTGLPSGSTALSYHYGQLGITSKLDSGYPEGKRVIEPIIVPHTSSSRPGGTLIVGMPTQLTFAPECKPAARGPKANEPPLEK
ncbi:MAG: hypothetical protein ACP5QZ_00970 [Candidatus Sumerlaeaceae bacterium]|jgi:hypothetical protein